MSRPRRLGECRTCHGWGRLQAEVHCRQNPLRSRCRRCGHVEHCNRNELCRLCLLTLRTIDKTWLASPLPGRPNQLAPLLPGLRLPIARALDQTPQRPRRTKLRNPRWVSAALAGPPVDDPTICPPLPAGQVPLLRLPRTLSGELASRILDRDVDGYEPLRQIMAAYAA